MFTPEQIEQLQAPLPASAVRQRKQGSTQVDYIEGWYAIAEANRIFGFGSWTRETVETRLVSERERKIGRPPYEKDGWGVTYIAKVRVSVYTADGGTIVREGSGAGHGIDVDLGQAHESAIKEAETDAMKRALMTFGNVFGLALYDKERRNVEDDRAPSRQRQTAPTGRNASDTAMRMKEAINKAENYEALQALVSTDRWKDGLAKLTPAEQSDLRDLYKRRSHSLSESPFGERAA